MISSIRMSCQIVRLSDDNLTARFQTPAFSGPHLLGSSLGTEWFADIATALRAMPAEYTWVLRQRVSIFRYLWRRGIVAKGDDAGMRCSPKPSSQCVRPIPVSLDWGRFAPQREQAPSPQFCVQLAITRAFQVLSLAHTKRVTTAYRLRPIERGVVSQICISRSRVGEDRLQGSAAAGGLRTDPARSQLGRGDRPAGQVGERECGRNGKHLRQTRRFCLEIVSA